MRFLFNFVPIFKKLTQLGLSVSIIPTMLKTCHVSLPSFFFVFLLYFFSKKKIIHVSSSWRLCHVAVAVVDKKKKMDIFLQ